MTADVATPSLGASDSTAHPTTVQIVITSQRRIDTPVGLSGTTSFDTWVSILDTTFNQYVSSAQDSCDVSVTDIGASASVAYAESFVVNVTVPQGRTFTFTSFARVAPNVGSVGNIVLTTTDMDMKVSVI